MRAYLFLLLLPLVVYSQGYQVKVVPIGNKEVNGNINVATLTLIFETNSIGKDIEAARMIAEKEALKIGADSITFISSTVYSSKVDHTFQGADERRSMATSFLGVAVGGGTTNSTGNSTLIATGTENDLATYTCRAIKIYKPQISLPRLGVVDEHSKLTKSSKVFVGITSFVMSVILVSILISASNNMQE